MSDTCRRAYEQWVKDAGYDKYTPVDPWEAFQAAWNRRAPAEQSEEKLINAFVQGAKWWEYYKTKFTMWQSDQNLAWKAASEKQANGSLGRLIPSPPGEEA